MDDDEEKQEKQKCVQPHKHQYVLENVFKGLLHCALISSI